MVNIVKNTVLHTWNLGEEFKHFQHTHTHTRELTVGWGMKVLIVWILVFILWCRVYQTIMLYTWTIFNYISQLFLNNSGEKEKLLLIWTIKLPTDIIILSWKFLPDICILKPWCQSKLETGTFITTFLGSYQVLQEIEISLFHYYSIWK